MNDRTIFVYCWATMGGVERVLLNRAEAFKILGSDFCFDVHFLHDCGGLSNFTSYIDQNHLYNQIRVINKPILEDYNRIFVIDTPDFIHKNPEFSSKIFAECHSGYAENRAYLKTLPEGIAGIIAPSDHFARTIESELPNQKYRVSTLRNTLPLFPIIDKAIQPLPWTKGFIFYIGRIDYLKNVGEILDACLHLRMKYNLDTIFVAVGHEPEQGNLRHHAAKIGMDGNLALLPSIPFHNTNYFLQAAALAGGIYVSASRAESFGLSVAEALVMGVPLVLSNIPAHQAFVEAGGVFLYDNGKHDSFGQAMLNALEWNTTSQRFDYWQSNLAPHHFLSDWNKLFN
jgi:glycosyltransferase involved in cell wall biosynthesis